MNCLVFVGILGLCFSFPAASAFSIAEGYHHESSLMRCSRDDIIALELCATRDSLPPPSTTTTTLSTRVSPWGDDEYPVETLRSFGPLALLSVFSLCTAFVLVAWEDYASVNAWPNRHMIVMTTAGRSPDDEPSTFGAHTIHGLAFGRNERMMLLDQWGNDKEQSLLAVEEDSTVTALIPEIRSFNEVSEQHRVHRVGRWRQTASTTTSCDASTMPQSQSKNSLESAIRDLKDVLLVVMRLKELVADYQWSQVHALVQSSVTPRLEPAANTLRNHIMASSSLLDRSTNSRPSSLYETPDRLYDAYEIVGFDWGSCAWRHCGALADAQEALDELDHLLGVLEPPECLFCLDVIERSLRDMLAVVPAQYKAMAVEGIPDYKRYHSVNDNRDEGEDGGAVLDQEYLRMLQELRNSGYDDNDE